LLRGLVPPETNGAAPYPVGAMLAAAKRFLISCKPSNPEVMSKILPIELSFLPLSNSFDWNDQLLAEKSVPASKDCYNL
jgi:hypothetical protein